MPKNAETPAAASETPEPTYPVPLVIFAQPYTGDRPGTRGIDPFKFRDVEGDPNSSLSLAAYYQRYVIPQFQWFADRGLDDGRVMIHLIDGHLPTDDINGNGRFAAQASMRMREMASMEWLWKESHTVFNSLCGQFAHRIDFFTGGVTTLPKYTIASCKAVGDPSSRPYRLCERSGIALDHSATPKPDQQAFAKRLATGYTLAERNIVVEGGVRLDGIWRNFPNAVHMIEGRFLEEHRASLETEISQGRRVWALCLKWPEIEDKQEQIETQINQTQIAHEIGATIVIPRGDVDALVKGGLSVQQLVHKDRRPRTDLH